MCLVHTWQICKEAVWNTGIDKRIILNWILKKQGKSGLNYFDSGQGKVAGFCEQFQEHSCSVKLGNFLTNTEYLSFSTRTLQREVCLFACYSWQICLLYHNICKSLSHAMKAKSSVKQLFRCFVTSVRLQVGCQLHDILLPIQWSMSNGPNGPHSRYGHSGDEEHSLLPRQINIWPSLDVKSWLLLCESESEDDHPFFQLNQPTRFRNFSSLLLVV